jgi:drug/metabolite transporter (DMT)-like permease
MLMKNKGTLLGMLAVLIWSTNVAFSRSLIESLGILTSGAFSFILAGLTAMLYLWVTKGSLRSLIQPPRVYLLWGGLLFVVNNIALNCAVGLAVNRTQVVAVALLNYLWPTFSLLFSIPILKKRARFYLPLGILVALGGVWLAATNGDLSILAEIFRSGASIGAYLLAFIAALTWGIYSNVSHRWGSQDDLGAVPLFILVSGLCMAVMRLFIPEVTVWSVPAVWNLAYMTVFPTMLAYIFWDYAMRRGQAVTVMALSYLIPLFSTIISVLVLGVAPSPSLWLAALMVIGGALTCRSAIDGKG